MARTIAVFGGSFNPPHVCHVLATAWALAALPVDAVWWVPAWRHAFAKALAQFDDRVRMCRVALEVFGDVGRVEVCAAEQAMGGESRTIDTLRWLRAQHPQDRFDLLIGSDILGETDQWKAWDEIVATTTVHVLGRAGYRPEEAFGVELPAVSSTAVRAALARGDIASCRVLLPRRVLEMIVAEGWYGCRG